jgi:hypothetical protein
MIGGDGECIEPLEEEKSRQQNDDVNDTLMKRIMKDGEDAIDRQQVISHSSISFMNRRKFRHAVVCQRSSPLV